MDEIHIPTEKIKDAEVALNMLKQWNNRFVENNLISKNDYSQIRETFISWQNPFAIVICCSDSRVAPEIFFDQKLGNIFVVRNAWNIVNNSVLCSVEYAVWHLWVPLVVVVWHTNCGAVTAACTCRWWDLPSSTNYFVDAISPSIKKNSSVDEVSKMHAKAMIWKIEENEVVKSSNTKVLPALYDVVTWKVEWL